MPGPGNYQITSPFDKYNNLGKKLLRFQQCLTTKGKDNLDKSHFSYFSTPKDAMKFIREKCFTSK